MLNNKRLRNILLFVLLLLLAGVIGIFLWNSRKSVTTDEEVIVVKDNVITLTSDIEEDEQPIEITEDKLIFNKPVPYKKGDVIVSGIIDSAPNGFIRKVVSISRKGEVYIVETENGVLTDVFEELHITRTFALTENGLDEGEINTIGNVGATLINTVALKQDTMSNYRYTTLATTKNKHSESDDLDTEYQFTLPFEFEMEDNISAEGEVGFSIWLEIEIDIHKGDIIFGIVAHNNSGGELFVGCSAEGKKEFEKEIFSKKLPNFQFTIGTVPVVVTNELQAMVEGEANIEGTIGTSVKLKSENSFGFLYTSKTNKVKEINERNYLSDGLSWQTKTKAAGGCSAGVSLHLLSTLYGSTGSDISIAIVGEAEGKVGVGLTNTSNGIEYVGSIDLSVAPQVYGNVVVSVPIIDKQLADKPIFRIELPAFWEEHWDSGDDWNKELEQLEENLETTLILEKLQKGDFSAFSGIYKATKWCNDGYGGGKSLQDLVLHANGVVTGGGSWYMPEFYPDTAPISVVANEEGAYVCQWDKFGSYDICRYTIYPEGVIDGWMEECGEYYLKDTVYIVCYQHGGEGASDGPLQVVYYLNE